MRVLLSGGAGFIGSPVAEALLRSHHEVAIVDDLSSGERENTLKGVHLYEMDIRTGCAEIFKDFESEVFCHQAAQMDVHARPPTPHGGAGVGARGTHNHRERQRLDEELERERLSRSGDQRNVPRLERHLRELQHCLRSGSRLSRLRRRAYGQTS